MKPSDFNKSCNRWILYLDLLGFRNRVIRCGSDTNRLLSVVAMYHGSRRIMDEWVAQRRYPATSLGLASFSDTFLIYTDDDSGGAFARIEQAARFIVNRHLDRHIPIRGAISCGPMYADNRNGVYIGRPFIEAYDHAENQNWIGLLLCRSATQRLSALKLPASKRLNYRRWKIPWTKKKGGLKPLYAYIIGAAGSPWGQNDYLDVLHKMMSATMTPRDRNKYLKTIAFLEQRGIFYPASPPSPIA